ncbi:hypothetical protein KAR91_85600, partial [Candidatus Pacearchaeota archaeon]|nr:hypothetical protein [Candidatus Pacearchaeota archaeon]
KNRDEIAKSETKRNEQNAQINTLKDKRAGAERDLANDTSNMKPLLDEKLELNNICIEITGRLTEANYSRGQAVKDRDANTKKISSHLALYNKAKVDLPAGIAKLEEAVENVIDTCPTCRRGLDSDEIEKAKDVARQAITDAKAQNEETLKSMRVTGNSIGDDITAAKDLIEARDKDAASLTAQLEAASEKRDTRSAVIDSTIKNRDAVDPKTDPLWQKYDTAIADLESGLVESVTDELEKLDKERDEKQAEVDKINALLANSDTIKDCADRITVYLAREKELAQLIADIDRLLDEIDEYGKEESRLIEEAVNGMFEHVEFKLFKELLKESSNSTPVTVPTCVATYNGVLYPDLSTGQKILVKIDIRNTLCRLYGIEPVLFLDHAEVFTLWDKIGPLGQVIKLKAVEGVKELTIEME